MRAAPGGFPLRLLEYTSFDLPRDGDSGLRTADAADRAAAPVSPRTLQPDFPGQSLAADQEQRVLDSPYAKTYELAHRLAEGQPTTYDTVKSIQGYLQRGFEYSEKPPIRRYPLASFLFEDRIGYCQQFSGAMTLMLRMNGIPARVAAGFTPGNFDHQAKEYRVRDLDAHSWVEVWFTGIGWVPSGAEGQGSKAWLIGLAILVVVPLAVVLLWLWSALHKRPHFHRRDEGAVEELRHALRRLGYDYPAGTTLRELERRLKVTAGPDAARYVALLRRQRYSPPGSAEALTARDRRALRKALTDGGGPLARLRGLVALPPHARFTAD
jgi:hypothetical protein